MGLYTSGKSHPNPSPLSYIPHKAEITAVNYANLLNIRFTL